MNFLCRSLFAEKRDFIDDNQLLLLWKGSHGAGFGDVVFVAVDLDFIVAGDHIRLVDVDVGSLLVGGQDDLVVDAQRTGVLQDHAQVLGTLHVVLASVVVVADVRNLFVNGTPVISLPLVIVVLVAVVLIWVLVVLVLPGDLENHLVLLLLVQVVGVDQLELRVVADIVVLFHLFVFLDDVQSDGFSLDQELWILVFQKWRQILVLPLGGLFGVEQVLSVHHLQFVVSVVCGEVRVLHELGVQVELVRCKWVDGHESDDVCLGVLQVTDILDGLL